MPKVTVNGKAPENPFGTCFDAAAFNLLGNYENEIENMRMCHGIGISNHPETIGKTIAHAWIEFDHKDHGRVAVDPIFLVAQTAQQYRGNFKCSLVVEYTKEQFMQLWAQHDFPGPWDSRIAQHTKEAA